MKNTIKIITIFAFVALFFTACNKESNNNTNSQAHKARYEVVSLGEEEAEIELFYSTQKGVGYCNGITTVNEIATTPWQHEFIIYQSFSFYFDAEVVNYYENKIPVKAYLYIDDVLVAEGQNNNSSVVYFSYYCNY